MSGYIDPYDISDPTTGQPILAAFGDVLRDDLEWVVRNAPRCSVKESTPKAIGTGVWTRLEADEENSDIGGMHSTSVNTARILVPALVPVSLFELSCSVTFGNHNTGNRYVGFSKNGPDPAYSVDSQKGDTNISPTLSGSTSLVGAGGDFFECHVFQDSGVNLDCTLNDLSVRWVAFA